MRKTLLATAVAAAIVAGGGALALASDTIVNMNAIGQSGPGPKVGTVAMSDTSDGANLKLNLGGLPPGPNRFEVMPGTCELSLKDIDSKHLAMLQVKMSGDAAAPLNTTVELPGTTIESMKGHALLVLRGGQESAKKNAHEVVACGVVW